LQWSSRCYGYDDEEGTASRAADLVAIAVAGADVLLAAAASRAAGAVGAEPGVSQLPLGAGCSTLDRRTKSRARPLSTTAL